MKKVWLISSIGLVAILLIVGNMLFKERVEKTSGDDLSEVHEEETVTVDENGNVITVDEDGNVVTIDENGNPITVDESGDPLVQGNLSTDGQSNGTVFAASKDLDAQLTSGSSGQGGDGLQAEKGAGSSSSAMANQGQSTSSQGSTQSNGREISSGTQSASPSNSSQGGSGTSEQNSSGKTESVTSIKNRYFPQFQQLEWEQNGKLEALAQRAFEDYITSERGHFDAGKYRSQASALQSSADSAFYSKYGKMQDELVANGHSRQAAANFKQSYESKKASRERELRELVEGF
ncbi:hypothetical protein [Halalkalibacter nanhaiisediminis]|uniref:Uncharacterized protein n=1 Tax=Halalkalibacter nanhaiisediminis TaxID=688079 RepID=A0A562QT37_9BACI|nr:hypothetical protein [Halalkalibacter nanhaiisediminis]TWI59919.1 hypothetical protein IQ10_00342 [Halalkalibacter nanhaiisediminis]